MSKEEELQNFLEPWYIASKEEAVTYLRIAGIDPDKSKKEFIEFIRAYNADKESEIKVVAASDNSIPE